MVIQEVEDRIMKIYKERRLTFPTPQDKPYIIRISAVLPVSNEYYIYKVGSGAVSNPADWFVLNLLRANTDAKLVGANTLRNEPGRYWTVEGFPELESHRKDLGKLVDINIMLTESGNIDFSENSGKVFHIPERIRPVILTTISGYKNISKSDKKGVILYTLDDLKNYNFMYVRNFMQERMPSVLILVSGEQVDYQKAFKFFKDALGIKEISVEAGPKVANELQSLGFIDELFLTVIPLESKVEKVGLLATESELNSKFIELSRAYGDDEGNIYPEVPENRKENEFFIFRRLRRK